MNLWLRQLTKIIDTPLNPTIAKITSRNKPLQNKFLAKACFVLGNGPSLNQMNLELLRDHYTFVLNNFISHPDLKSINPKFYIEIEPHSTLLDPSHPISGKTLYTSIYESLKTFEHTLIFMRAEALLYMKELGMDPGSNYYGIGPGSGILGRKNPRWNIGSAFDFSDGAMFAGLAIAMFLGFKKIFIIGADFDHIITKTEAHFYKDTFKPALHGAPNLVLAKNLVSYLEKMKIVKQLSDRLNVSIYNAGIGGMTDTFPRIDYHEALDICRKSELTPST